MLQFGTLMTATWGIVEKLGKLRPLSALPREAQPFMVAPLLSVPAATFGFINVAVGHVHETPGLSASLGELYHMGAAAFAGLLAAGAASYGHKLLIGARNGSSSNGSSS